MPIGDKNRKQEGDFISAADRNDIAARLANIENGFASGNGGLSSSFLTGAGGGSVPIQVQPEIKPFQTRKTGSNTIEVGYLRPYETAGGVELIQSKAIVDHINVLEITGTTRVIYPIEFPEAEEITLDYTGGGSNTQMSYIYYLISYDAIEGEWIATLSQKSVDSWPPTLNHRETIVIIGIVEVNTNVSGNPGGEWHQLLDENKTIEILNSTESDEEYLPFDGVQDGITDDYDFQPGLVQVGEADTAYAGQTIAATASYKVYANILIDASSTAMTVALYDEAGTTQTNLLFATVSTIDEWTSAGTKQYWWRVLIGEWDSEKVWTQKKHGNLVFPDITQVRDLSSGGGGCSAITGDDTWIEQDSVDPCQVNHIGPGPDDVIATFSRSSPTAAWDIAVDDAAVTWFQLVRDEKGHVTIRFPDQCNCDVTSELNPTTLLTVTWTGPSSTKTIKGCSFTNGETKELCSDSYTRIQNTISGTQENWIFAQAGETLSLLNYKDVPIGPSVFQNLMFVKYKRNVSIFGQWKRSQTRSGTFASTITLDSTAGLTTETFTPAGWSTWDGYVNDNQFGQVTFNDGTDTVTVMWMRKVSDRSGQKHWAQTGGTVA